jgi:type II secretory ATPase GspE/PulE/Tfp pilus assembly ATPase PilB-like protein
MASPSGNRVKAHDSQIADRALSTSSKPGLKVELDTELTFRLIDSILPFEACLYHQIIPLSLEGSRIKLGMVNLDDSAALDYVRRILAYMNCSLVPQSISSDEHHRLLSAYLNHTGKQKQLAARSQRESPDQEAAPASRSPDKPLAKSAEKAKAPSIDRNAQPTLVVDSPEELSFIDFDVAQSEAAPVSSPPEPDPVPSVDAAKAQKKLEEVIALRNEIQDRHEKSTVLLDRDTITPSTSAPDPLEIDGLPILDIHAQHLSDSAEALMSLPPNQLLQELLARVLVGGIGRLYIERQQQRGRVLWSQNGILQSVLENVEIPVIQGLINELKRLTHLPMITVEKPKQVEIERLYQKHRLLLRLRVMPGTHGEEATLQVLRGAALKFYQQQQLANLSRDALGIAQQLQNKVNEIRTRTRFESLTTADQLDILPALQSLLKQVDHQLNELREIQKMGHSAEESERL